MSSSRVRRLAAAAILALAAASLGARAWRGSISRIRPAPAVALVIEGDYLDKLDDPDCRFRCDTLLNALESGVRAELDRKFPFIDWVANPAATDTIVLRWQNGSGAFLGSQLRYELWRGGQLVESVIVRPFEKEDDLLDRMDWSAAAVEREWLARLPASLEGSDLLQKIFGRVPLNAAVAFPETPTVIVPVHPDTLKAPRGPRGPHPTFELTVLVSSPELNLSEDGIVLLDKCNRAFNEIEYQCPVAEIAIPNDTFRSTRLDHLLRTKAVKWRETRLRAYTRGTAGIPLRTGR